MKRIHSHEHGLSLIELLIALAISSLLVLGIVQIYIDNRSNYLFQQGQSDNNENARYMMLILEEELRRVGYRIDPGIDLKDVFKPETAGLCSFVSGEVINYNAVAKRICLRYKPHLPDISACDGIARNTATAPYLGGEPIDNIVVDLDFFSDELRCNGQPIVSGLVDFQLEFGINPDPYKRQTGEFTLNPAGNTIYSVRYAALIKSRYENLAEDTNNLVYERWYSDRYDTAGLSAPDRALYLATENTVTLRNVSR